MIDLFLFNVKWEAFTKWRIIDLASKFFPCPRSHGLKDNRTKKEHKSKNVVLTKLTL
jgi:hypothetical protein